MWDPRKAMQAMYAWIANWDIQIPSHIHPDPKIKPEVVSDDDINILLNEIETPESEVETVRKLTQDILALTEQEALSGNNPALNRMIALTDDRAWYLPRFEDYEMVYRDYVGIHSERISLLCWTNRPLFKEIFWPDFNDHYLTLYARVHDILEWLSPFWDIPTPLKLSMTQRSKDVMDLVERKLWEIYIRRLPLAHGEYEYDEAMLEDMITKESLESQVLSYFDKVDGFITCFHELVAWNDTFLEPFHNYIAIFKDIKSGVKLPNLQVYFNWGSSSDTYWELKAFSAINDILAQEDRIEEFLWKCPTTESMKENISEDFWLPMYKVWKKYVKMMSTCYHTDMISWEDLLCQRGREIKAPNWLY